MQSELRPLRRASVWIADCAYVLWRQLAGFASRDTPRDFQAGSRSPVLVLPGVYERWHFLLPLIRKIHKLGHPVHVVDSLGSNRGSVLAAAETVDAYLALHNLHDVLIVAHSKGGLIGKHLMSFGGSAERIREMVTIATPFAGSRYARLVLNATLREFRPDNTTITLLSDTATVNERITSVFPLFDPFIPEGSALLGAKNTQIHTAGHFLILRHPEIESLVVRVAETPNT